MLFVNLFAVIHLVHLPHVVAGRAMSLSGVTTGRGVLTIPMQFFHECEGLTISVELKSGDIYRGRASNTEDNFNVHLDTVTITPARGGPVRTVEKIFIRGSNVVFIVFPDILVHSPLFKRVRNAAEGKIVAKGLGVGRLMAMQAKSACPLGCTQGP